MKKFYFIFFILLLTSQAVFSQETNLIVQSKHDSKVLQSKFSYDGKWIATSDENGKIIIWDSETKKRIRTLENNGYPAKALVFHPEKNILLSSSNNTIIQWNIYNGKIVRIFNVEHEGFITSLDFNGDGSYFVSGSIDETACVWKFSNGKMKQRLKQNLFYNNSIYSVKFSKYDDYIFTAGEDININMWDWHKNKVIRKFKHHKYRVNNITLNNTNSLLASASNDQKVNVWNVNTGKRVASFQLPDAPAQNVIFHPTKDRLLATYYKNYTDSSRLYIKQRVEGRMIMWDINKLKSVWDKKLQGGILDISISADNKSFITANSDSNIKIFNLANGSINYVLGTETQINDIVFVDERNEFITAGNSGIIKIWDSKKLIIKGIIESNVPSRVSTLDYDYTSGNLIAAIGSSIFIWNYDYTQKKYLLLNTFKIPISKIQDIKLTDFSNKIFIKRELSFNRFNIEKLDAYKDGIAPEDLVQTIDSVIVEVYDFTGNFLYDYLDVAHKNILFASNNNVKIAYNNIKNQIEESDYNDILSNRKEIFKYDEELNNSNNSFLDKLASNASNLTSNVSSSINTNANSNTHTKISRNTERKELKRLTKINQDFSIANDKFNFINYSFDGTYLASCGKFDYVEIYDLASNKYKRIGSFNQEVNYFDFSKDNSMLATVSDNKIQIWNVKNGALEKEFISENPLTEVHFFETDKKLLTYGLDDGMKVWNINEENILATIISVGKNDFITFSENNYYIQSENGNNGIAVEVDETAVPIECFKMKYNRPEIVLDKLGFKNENIIIDYAKEYNKNLEKFGIEQNEFDISNIPTVEILNKAKFKWYTYNKIIDLELKASDINHNLQNIKIYVNGVPILKEKQKDISRYNTDIYNHNYNIELNNGKNVIYTYAVNNKGAESIKDSLVLVLKNKKNKIVKKPDLYIIALGTYNFTEKNLSSTFNLDNTRNLVRILGKDVGKKYQNIIIDTLYNDEALKYKLLKLKRKYRKVGVDDEFIVISSGYSVLKNNFDVYFATHNMDFSEPEKNGIPHKLINNMLSEIPSRKKLLIVDSWQFIQNETANSLNNTGIDKDLSEITYTSYDPAKNMRKDIFKQMYSTSGTTVLFTNSIDNENQKVNIVTKTLFVGYNKGKADFNNDGIISSYELNRFIDHQNEIVNQKGNEINVAVYRDL